MGSSARVSVSSAEQHMQLPFTPNQFFSIFAAYNHAFWIVVIVMWFATLAILVVVWREPARWTRLLSFLLGTLWLWNAVAYHAFLFTRINPAAWVFAEIGRASCRERVRGVIGA